MQAVSRLSAVVPNDQENDQEWRQLDTLAMYAADLVPHLQKPEVTDVCTNADGRIWIKQAGQFRNVGRIQKSQVELTLRMVAQIQNVPFNHSAPFLETIFPLDGSRIEGLMPPIVESPVIAIRLRAKKIHTLGDYAATKILTHQDDPLNQAHRHDEFLDHVPAKQHDEILALAVKYRQNIVTAGATSSGKTTLLNALIAEIAEDYRLVVIEDTPELQPSVPNHVALLATSKISQEECVERSLRLAPDFLVLGEVRTAGAARALVGAWNTGHSGFVTVHANSAREALYRFEDLINGPTARGQVARAVNLVVFIDEENRIPAHRKVREIVVVDGIDPASGDYKCISI